MHFSSLPPKIQALYTEARRGRGACECWPWPGNRNGKGYGDFGGVGVGYHLAHRVAIGLERGDDRVGIHFCDNPPCVNPFHLAPGTNAANIKDAAMKGRMAHGDRHHRTKVPDADIPKILARLANGVPCTVIAAEYDVTRGAISNIKGRKRRRASRPPHPTSRPVRHLDHGIRESGNPHCF